MKDLEFLGLVHQPQILIAREQVRLFGVSCGYLGCGTAICETVRYSHETPNK